MASARPAVVTASRIAFWFFELFNHLTARSTSRVIAGISFSTSSADRFRTVLRSLFSWPANVLPAAFAEPSNWVRSSPRMIFWRLHRLPGRDQRLDLFLLLRR